MNDDTEDSSPDGNESSADDAFDRDFAVGMLINEIGDRGIEAALQFSNYGASAHAMLMNIFWHAINQKKVADVVQVLHRYFMETLEMSSEVRGQSDDAQGLFRAIYRDMLKVEPMSPVDD